MPIWPINPVIKDNIEISSVDLMFASMIFII
jgi:hypothetical protein